MITCEVYLYNCFEQALLLFVGFSPLLSQRGLLLGPLLLRCLRLHWYI